MSVKIINLVNSKSWYKSFDSEQKLAKSMVELNLGHLI